MAMSRLQQYARAGSVTLVPWSEQRAILDEVYGTHKPSSVPHGTWKQREKAVKLRQDFLFDLVWAKNRAVGAGDDAVAEEAFRRALETICRWRHAAQIIDNCKGEITPIAFAESFLP